MDERLVRIENKVDRLIEIQTYIQVDVAEHIRRTEIAESNIKEIAKEIKPIQEHVAFLKYSGKLVTILAAVAGAVVALIQLIKGN
jgi:nitrogen fixation/metabolism regulation signal transduction histidine kinase